jgi:hypothetical protein
MHIVNVTGFAGVGLLAIGAMSSVSDLAPFHTSYGLLAGPLFWIVGCALMVAWAIGRVGLALRHSSHISEESPSALREETMPHQPTKSEAAALGSRRGAVAGQVVADFLVPLAIWFIVLSFMATIVLLLGSGPA